jgi:hypothetical protein
MRDEHTLTLRQADLARGDFYEIRAELEIMQAQLARLPTHGQLAQAALGIIFATASLVIVGMEVLSR